jgi:hypothetical protein
MAVLYRRFKKNGPTKRHEQHLVVEKSSNLLDEQKIFDRTTRFDVKPNAKVTP